MSTSHRVADSSPQAPCPGTERRTPGDVHAQWQRIVEAELSAISTTHELLAADGFDVTDPFAASVAADVAAAGSTTADFVDAAGWSARAVDAMHVDAGIGSNTGDHVGAGWTAATIPLLGDLPGGEDTAIADLAPGLELASVLTAVPVEHMSAYHLADAVAGWERMIAWAQANQASAATELTRRPEVQASDPSARSASLHPIPVTAGDLCTVWPWTKPQAQRVVDQAVQLVDFFPQVHEALADGRLDARRARILTDALRDRDPEVARVVEAAVLPHVHRWTSVKVSYVVNRLLAELAPEDAKKRHRRARRDRRVFVEPDADGMAWLHAYLPAEDAHAIMATLTAAAETQQHAESRAAADTHADDTTPNDSTTTNAGNATASTTTNANSETSAAAVPRTLDQARADMLAALAWASLGTGRLGGSGCADCGSPFGVPLASAHGRPVSVNVTVPLSTLIGLDEHPGELEGYGPIDADTARHLAAAGIWRWIGTHPVGGHALNYGRTRYAPPQDLVDFVLLRDRECQMPGCHRPAYRCEIDHRVPYPEGPTSACNCSALCKPCHLQKHRAGWTVEQLSPESQRWTSPTGHHHIVNLPRLAPDPPMDLRPDPTAEGVRVEDPPF